MSACFLFPALYLAPFPEWADVYKCAPVPGRILLLPKIVCGKKYSMNTTHNSTHEGGMNSTYHKGIYTASGRQRAVATNLTILELCLIALPPVEVQ